MRGDEPFIAVVGEEVVVSGGAFAGERATVVAREDDLVTVELVLEGRPTKMAFDVSALARPHDPRAAFRVELERAYRDAAREDMIRWFSERPEGEDPVETDELGMLYQIASPVRRAYLALIDELEAALSDAAIAERGVTEASRRWEAGRADRLARLSVTPLEPSVRARALALMDQVRAAAPPDEGP